MLDPGRGKTATGRLWAYVVDDRGVGATSPPLVWYHFTRDRTGAHPRAQLGRFSGFLQADGYAGDDQLYATNRITKGEEVAEAPAIRVEGDLTIVPILEERVVVEKRLFLVEELHLQRTYHSEAVEVPVTLRRTRVDVEREDLNDQESH